jgi:hypothetical protein
MLKGVWSASLEAGLRAALGQVDVQVALDAPEWLMPPRPAPLDFAYLAFRDRRGRRALVFRLSAPGMPEQVARGMRGAREAAAALPSALAQAILLPLAEGELEGRSWAIQRYVPPVSKRRVLRRAQVRRLRPVVLEWLSDVVAATSHPVPEEDIESRVRPALRRLRDFPAIGEPVCEACGRALARLDSGQWTPMYTLAHNDFWIDNVLLENPIATALGAEPRFRIIDWPASRVDGFPVYDLTRMAMSTGLRGRALTRALERLAHQLAGDVADLPNYVLCSAGEMAADLENFPVDWFRVTVSNTLATAASVAR